MDELVIGKTRIPVAVRRNDRLKKCRLSVDQHGVLVEAPSNFPEMRLASFVELQKEWIFQQWEGFKGRQLLNAWPERFVSGAKVMFLGRLNLLEIRRSATDEVRYGARGFQIDISVPPQDEIIKALLVDYFQEYLEGLIVDLTENHPALLSGAKPVIRFTQRRDRWAYCDEKQVIHIGWDLAFLPKQLIEYVLIHELCHLAHRNHQESFWKAVASFLPEYREREQQLNEYEFGIKFENR